MGDGDRLIGVQQFRTQPDPFVDAVGQQRRLLGREIAVIREHEDRLWKRFHVDHWLTGLVELDHRPLEFIERLLEPPSIHLDAGTGFGGQRADGLVAVLEGLANQSGGRALVGVEPAQVLTVEDDREFVLGDELDPDVLADAVGGDERGRNGPAESVEAAGPAREVVEREVGRGRNLVTDEHELAHIHTTASGGIAPTVSSRGDLVTGFVSRVFEYRLGGPNTRIGVTDQRPLECVPDDGGIVWAARGRDGPDGRRIERDVERVVDRLEDGRHLVSSVDEDDPGGERGVLANPLGDTDGLPMDWRRGCCPRFRSVVRIEDRQRVRPRTERVGRLAALEVEPQPVERAFDRGRRPFVPVVGAVPEIRHRLRTRERQGRLAVVGDGPAAHRALERREATLAGTFPGQIVALETPVAAAEGDLSVGRPDADRGLAVGSQRPEACSHLSVGVDTVGTTADDQHSRPFVSTLLKAPATDAEPMTEDASRGGEDRKRVPLPAAVLSQYVRFSLYNSPYPAHDGGCAVDCYPGTLRDGRTTAAPSPVSGTVREVRTVDAPPKPHAVENDHLILLECERPEPVAGLTARILHVDPAVTAGDRVERDDSLGTLVRSGFFAPWVDNHLHVGFRGPEQNPYRASGSLPLEPDVALRPLAWDGTGTVVATGDTYAVLDAPTHPAPGETFVGIRTDDGGVLDGGLPHYGGGGRHVVDTDDALESDDRSSGQPVSLNDDHCGVVGPDGRTVAWDDVVVTVNGDPITGLSTFCARDADFGAKLICPDRSFQIGETVRVRIRSSEEP